MSNADTIRPSAGIWVRRIGVLALAGLAGLLIQGPSLAVISNWVGPMVIVIIWRGYQRSIAETQALRYPHRARQPLSKRTYALLATLFVLASSLPLWLLCDKLLIAITLLPALVCIWFAIYLLRGT